MEISEVNANNINPEYRPQNVASDLGLQCLPITKKIVFVHARTIGVAYTYIKKLYYNTNPFIPELLK